MVEAFIVQADSHHFSLVSEIKGFKGVLECIFPVIYLDIRLIDVLGNGRYGRDAYCSRT